MIKFIPWFVRFFVRSIACSFIHWFPRFFTLSFGPRSFFRSVVRWFVCFPDFFTRWFVFFVLSFAPLVIRSLVCSLFRLFFRLLARSFFRSLVRSNSRSLCRLFTRSFVPSLACPLVCSLSVRTFNDKLPFTDPYERVNVKQ